MNSPADKISDTAPPPHAPTRIRALPGKWIDLVHDGVSDQDIRTRGHDPAVWSALISVAMSAINHGWPENMFTDVMLDPRRRLGQQASLKHGKPRGRKQTIELLRAAWEKGQDNIRQSPAHTAAELQFTALRTIKDAAKAVTAQRATLTREERLVIDFVIERLRHTKSTQTAISRQTFLDGTGLGKTALGTAQRRLQAKGLLVLVEKGLPSGPGARRRRATVWAIADASADLHSRPETGESHASNTGNRYVAPAPSSGAPSHVPSIDLSPPRATAPEPVPRDDQCNLTDLSADEPAPVSRESLNLLLDLLRAARPSRVQTTCMRQPSPGGRAVGLPYRRCSAPDRHRA